MTIPWYLPMASRTPKIMVIINWDANQASQPSLKFWACFIFIDKMLKFHSYKKSNMTVPFNYNLIFLLLKHVSMIFPTTFIVKILTFMGTSVYWPWTEGGIHSSKYKTEAARLAQPLNSKILCFLVSLGQVWAPILWSLKYISYDSHY